MINIIKANELFLPARLSQKLDMVLSRPNKEHFAITQPALTSSKSVMKSPEQSFKSIQNSKLT